MKRYKTKKAMWNRIAQDLKEILNIERTGVQCKNRYKTVIKRKKKSIDNNSKSGSSRMEVEYEELKKISAADGSIEPEILRGVTNIKNNVALKSCNLKISNTEVKKKTKKSLQDILYDINERKEAAKQRRHKEKLKLLKELYKKGCKDQENMSESGNQENEN
ncbi:uncharacterized protein LOC114939495 [Nylanderia fulva]|uniref:uncharacterized protein LOC114939495 n=1 Tax=Nylanderia fulva TaxID=613905 RepID=UPI0010FB87BA|nr:uncharacterized protein LOC114939495 [Nylanderia fulva]